MTTLSGADGFVCSGAWYVLETKRHCETRAQAYLQSQNITAYLPMTQRWPRPAVGSSVGPVFPGYLFVRLDLLADHRVVSAALGVKRFVAFGDSGPAEVPTGIIELLRSREDNTGLVQCELAATGDAVKISHGAFKDLYGVVGAQLSARERVIILMELLQREVRVEVPASWIQRA
jgi:transcriptional antiterminator RfaH